jgi:hypothetical protein
MGYLSHSHSYEVVRERMIRGKGSSFRKSASPLRLADYRKITNFCSGQQDVAARPTLNASRTGLKAEAFTNKPLRAKK